MALADLERPATGRVSSSRSIRRCAPGICGLSAETNRPILSYSHFMDVHGIAKRRMDEAGHMYTRARRLIMDTLTSAATPATIQSILHSAPTLVQSSLYRNLAVLQDAGLVTRVDVGDDRSYYELSEAVTNDHHHHLVCRSCRSVVDIALPKQTERSLDKAFVTAATEAGFDLEEHRVDLVGVCSNCRAA
jgi:Fur family transcriptional regulator, ferric uptake regulator